MSHAITALILIHLDAHQGEWCSVYWLAGRLLMPVHKLNPVCVQLTQEGQIQHAKRDGVDCYGVHVPEALAIVNDVRAEAPRA